MTEWKDLRKDFNFTKEEEKEIKVEKEKLKPTRYYSHKQEKQIAKTVGGKLQANSGATLFSAGDVKTDDWLFEAKTCMKEQESFSIKKEWLEKLRQESFAMNKEYNAVVFNFGPDTANYYILNEKTMKKILNILDEKFTD